MTAERWRRIEGLYVASLHKSADGRAAFLSESCGGDDALRLEVESLLAAHDSDPAFMETPLMQLAVDRLVEAYAVTALARPVGPYQLRSLIGAGGMGEVYRAWDPRLEREVGVKMLRMDEDAAPERRHRLVREAKTAASLSHPNICTVFEVGESDGRAFIVMELVDGRTLAELIHEQPIDSPTAVSTAIQCAAALKHAHERGVLHRDLKAANIMRTPDGTVKVLDFGLARHLDARGVEILTQRTNAPVTGMRGTLAYMAPELLRGELADVRTDIWSLGVTMFEMLTRELPFRGNSDFELASAILSGRARELPSHVPPRMRRIVRRCLTVDSSLRFQSAADVHQALVAYQRQAGYRWAEQIAWLHHLRIRWNPAWSRFAVMTAVLVVLLVALAGPRLSRTPRGAGDGGGITLTSRAHLAVLPTQLIGTAAAEPHLGIVIPDMITTRLAASKGVRVRPTAAVIGYGDPVDANAIGHSLRVDHVLKSTLWRGADSYRLTLQLVDTRESIVIWAQAFTLSIEELPRIEASVATRVLRALRLPVERPLAVKPLGLTRAAYDDYLQGRAMLIRQSPEALTAAASAFERVLKTNPEFAPAHAALALVSARLYWRAGRVDVDRWAERAKAAAERALSLDPSLADAHQAIAAVYRYNESDWIRTIDESRLALGLDPSLDLPHYNLAVAFYHLGLFDISQRASLAGVIANPATRYDSLLNRGRVALYSGAYGDAEALLEEAARLEGGDPPWILAEAHYYNGHPERAEALLRPMFGRAGALNRTRAGASLAAFFAAGGREDEARHILRQTLNLEPSDHHAVYRIGTAFAQLDDPASAVRWLRRAAESGFPCYAWFASDPLTMPLRDDASFRRLLSELRGSAERWRAQYGSLYRSPDSVESSESPAERNK